MISQIDHLVITVHSLETTCSFYQRVLKCSRSDIPGRPTALHLGSCKINVHELGHTFDPKARAPTPGAADFCLISDEDIDTLRQHLESEGVKIEVGPVERAGSRRPMISLYFRDPDENLIEVSRYMPCL